MHCHIAYGQLAVNLPAGHLSSAIPVLIDILRDVPHVQFDPSLNWAGRHPCRYTKVNDSHIFQIGHFLTSSSIPLSWHCSNLHPVTAPRGNTSLSQSFLLFVTLYPSSKEPEVCLQLSVQNETKELLEVISHAAPAFHGLYRAVISTSFSWSITEWLQLSQALSDLLDADLVEHFGNHLTAAIDSPQEQAILSRYIAANRPLTGYFVLCCIMEIEWTVLAQSLQTTEECTIHTEEEAAAANAAWSALTSKKVTSPPQVKKDIGEGLRQSINVAMQCFTDLLAQMESLETEPSSDTYAWETMAESVVSHRMPSFCRLDNPPETCCCMLRSIAGD